jgi:hypothetical protein
MSVSYKQAFTALLILEVLFLSRVIFLGEVIFPHNNDRELLTTSSETSSRISNRKFSDASSVYIPGLCNCLKGNSHSWISTWNPHVQMGRPCFLRGDDSTSYLISYILGLFISDPFRLFTTYTVLMIFLTCTFCFLLLKALRLHPVACFVVSAGIGLGVMTSYWFTRPVTISTICWTLCLLWLITALFEKRSTGTVLGIAFAVYSLLMTGRHQTIVANVYLVAGYTLMLLWRSDERRSVKVGIASAVTAAFIMGILAALPAYADLFIRATGSTRLQAGSDFFLAVLPKIGNLQDLGIFLSLMFDAFWFGSPIVPHYPYEFNGHCLTPLYFSLFLISFFDRQYRSLWPWQLFVILCLFGTLWPPAYLFAVDHLGFHLSRHQLISSAWIPAFVLAGYGADHLIRNGIDRARLAALVIVLPAAVLIVVAGQANCKLDPLYMIFSVVILLSIVFIIISRRYVQPVLISLATIGVFAYGFTLQLTRPLDNISISSPVVEATRNLSKGYRYAKVGSALEGIMPANEEGLLRLNSIFSYDGLSPREYQRVVTDFDERGTQTVGRWFGSIASDSQLDGEAFSYTGVNVLLTLTALNTKKFVCKAEVAGILLYERTSPPVVQAQIPHFLESSDGIQIKGFLDDQERLNIESLISLDDYMSFKVTPSDQKTVLFLSQQYHPSWKAWSNDVALKTVKINGFYLGVVVPRDTETVIIEFKPYVLWSWIPQFVFVLLALGMIGDKLFRRVLSRRRVPCGSDL